MDYDQIKNELKHSSSLQLLRSQNAPLIVSFLHKQFKENQRTAIKNSELTSKLEDYLEFIRESEAEGAYPQSPQQYLNQWCDDQYLRKTYEPGSDDPVFKLTPAIEKVLKWLGELIQPPEFVVTESRFYHIFDLLKEIRDYSTTDVETRLAQLEEERDRIQQEIDKIRQTGVVTRYDSTKIKEKFILANNVASELLGDFAEVTERFRALTRTIQEEQLQENSYKGSVVGRVLNADQEIKESDQGRSFYGFWNFLMSGDQQRELKSLIQEVYNLDELRSLMQKYGLLRRIERHLMDAGEQIIQSNHRLAEKLRQMLDESNLSENRRVAELIREIEGLAIRVAKQPPLDEDFFVLEGEPNVNLVMERRLHDLEECKPPTFSLNFDNLPPVNLDEELTELYHQLYVDETELERRIAQALEHRPQVTLAELVEIYPVEQGLSEIVAYLAIASKSEQHLLNDNIKESIRVASLEPEKQLRLTLPQVIFRRLF
ncbi:DUF3375 domain-containing protein [Gloeothece verrucosa]|nr:DUF3375 domain-containing protein [Gloeothece verrucosa]